MQAGYGFGGGGGDGYYGGGGGSGYSTGGGGGSGFLGAACLPGSVTLAGSFRFPDSTALDDVDYPGTLGLKIRQKKCTEMFIS